jgi:integrase
MNIQYRRGRSRPWYVRWSVNGAERGPKIFATEQEADDYRSRLVLASRDGERWDLQTGLPNSWNATTPMDLASFCRSYLTGLGPGTTKPRTVAAEDEALSRFVVAAMPGRAPSAPGNFSEVGRWLRGEEVAPKLNAWLTRWSPQISALDKCYLAKVHDALLTSCDGKPLATNTLRRRFNNVAKLLDAAVRSSLLDTNELVKPSRATYTARKPKKNNAAYPNVTQMLELLSCVESHQPSSRMYRAMTAIGALAGLRPSEVVALEVEDLNLPEEGWGLLRVERARIGLAGFSEDSEEIGEPKVELSVRTIPMLPALVRELRLWLEHSGVETGPLFRTRNGRIPTQSNWGRCLSLATKRAGTRSMTPYDLRRFHGTFLAESGVPYNECARRMGHTLPTFMRYYVHVTVDVTEMGNAALDRAFQGL